MDTEMEIILFEFELNTRFFILPPLCPLFFKNRKYRDFTRYFNLKTNGIFGKL